MVHGILADIGIQHHHDFVRRVGHGFLQHTFHFFDFFHQMGLRGQTTSRIGQHDVDTARLGGFHGIEADGGRVAGRLGDHGNTVALAPFGQLLAGGGTESVAGGQQHAFALGLEIFG